ncbi:TPA: NAD-dependent malic enzyme, partial [Klebsiella pneumoniae]|nr:NAD-dependent malic enzyme [Klebsiella pneumoniae]
MEKVSMKSPIKGYEILENPLLNKGTAFTQQERIEFGLEGLLPPSVETLETQVERVLQHLSAKPNDLERYIYLIGLADRNETLFYKVVITDPVRFLPIIYDPTVADACLNFGHIYRRARGLYLTRDMKDRFAEVLKNWPVRNVRFICVSTGGRILG